MGGELNSTWSMKLVIAVVLLAVSALAAEVAPSAQTAAGQVVVVYNSAVPESREVADYYCSKRGIPAGNVIEVTTTTNVEMTRAEFQKTLQRPLAKAIQDRKLWSLGAPKAASKGERAELPSVRSSKIRYAVLCYGIPYRIVRDPELREEGTETWKPELRRNEAAVDTELALLPQLEMKPLLSGPLRNRLYQATNSWELDPTNGVLMVTRLDGPTAALSKGLVDKGLEAEKRGLWGRSYFDIRNISDPAYKPGDDAISTAAEICRRLGFETVMDTNGGTFPASFPMSQIAYYAGWYDETVSGPFALPKVEFMPGAFAYHLHSFSAATLRSTNHNWVGPLITKGVTATMGCVDEPYLGGTPDIAVFTGKFLYAGFNFGEAAYAAQSVLSWQTTIVGDPLYRPTAHNVDVLHQEFVRTNSTLAEWSTLRVININQANGKPVGQLAAYLEDLPLRRTSAVLTEKLASLSDALGKPSSAILMYSQALKLNPSPQQRIGLRLTMADRLLAQQRDREAFEDLKLLREEFPEYAGRLSVLKRLVDLGRKLGDQDAADLYEKEVNALSATQIPDPTSPAPANTNSSAKGP